MTDKNWPKGCEPEVVNNIPLCNTACVSRLYGGDGKKCHLCDSDDRRDICTPAVQSLMQPIPVIAKP